MAGERAATVVDRCDALAVYSEEAGRLTRQYGTAALRQAQETVAGWMRKAGLAVRRDNIGNLIGRYDGEHRGASATRAFMLGSHLDTVRDAGKYDGPLGVLVALSCIERLREQGRRLPFALEVIAFADEEGLRFHTAYLGSSAVAGTLDAGNVERRDADGMTLADAMRAFGGDPERLRDDARRPDEIAGYCEVHIEQGPILEQLDLPVGVVSAIAGQSRFAVEIVGRAGHVGTVPMEARRDALCAAAEFVLAVEEVARRESGLVATVGQLAVDPGVSNVIPGRVTLSLDMRHADDGVRTAACAFLQERAREICAGRGVAAEWRAVQDSAAVHCDADLSQLLASAIEVLERPVRYLSSGAGHDAVAMAALAPVAMLFVRCKGGVSHHPDEAVYVDDVAVAINVLDGFLRGLAASRYPDSRI